MILGETKIPSTLINNDMFKKDYLRHLKRNLILTLTLLSKANNKNLKDEINRLKLIEEFIKKSYNINISYKTILLVIFNNIEYDVVTNKIIVKEFARIGSVKINDLGRIIQYGAIGCPPSKVIEFCFKKANEMTLCRLFMSK